MKQLIKSKILILGKWERKKVTASLDSVIFKVKLNEPDSTDKIYFSRINAQVIKIVKVNI